MKQKEKESLSDYKVKPRKRTKEGQISIREIIKMNQEQTEELRIFLRSLARTKRTEREPYEKPIKAES